jgi:nucleoside 2-deoxyribosyltransferase
MSIVKNGFFAYGSSPAHSGEFIEDAIKTINFSGHLVDLQSWKRLSPSGNLVISEVLKKIIDSDFVCADLTGMNDNVLFEIGFAIGKRKPLWLINDTSITYSINRYKELNLLSTIGYTKYTSSKDIVDSFLTERVYEKNNDLIESIFSVVEKKESEKVILYLKSQHNTNYNQFIINKIEDYNFTYTMDDAEEVKVQPLSWYLEQLLSTPASLIEFSSINRSGFELHNSKCALIAGISYGLGLKLQMVAEEYYDTPIDYRELLKKFHNADTCRMAIEPFFQSLRNELPKIFSKKRHDVYPEKIKSTLQKIRFGEYIAEHESDELYNYYVDTAHEQNLIKSEHNIVVGRKGAGKTATLYYLNEKLSKDIRNQVCLIKPINFEIDGLISLVSSLKDEFEKGYLTESIWKFLIYTEIAKSIYSGVKDKATYALTENDEKIIEFVKRNKNIVLTDFSTRLEQEIDSLQSIKNLPTQSDFRLKISEILHENILKQLRELITNHFGKKQKLVVLIDNLDKSWRKGSNIDNVARFLLGLLGVIGRISKELRGKSSQLNVFEFNLVIFIRSDIFRYILNIAREPDKIEFTKLLWDDEEIFLRIINERIRILNESINITPEIFWETLIVETINGINIKKFLQVNIIPRPRDIIFFFNTAKNVAVSRGHSKIEENDILKAHSEYSNWVFKSIIVENGITMTQMHDFLYNLLGENVILDKNKLIQLMQQSGLKIDEITVEYFIDRLVALSLLGREVKNNEFEFVYDFENDTKVKKMATKFGSNRYKIHNAFVPYLESGI